MHYYFRRKPDLLVALVGRLPREHIDRTQVVVRDALAARFRWMVDEIRTVMLAALPDSRRAADVGSAAELLALAVSYRHSTARHAGEGPELQPLVAMHRELDFLAEALMLGAGEARM